MSIHYNTKASQSGTARSEGKAKLLVAMAESGRSSLIEGESNLGAAKFGSADAKDMRIKS